MEFSFRPRGGEKKKIRGREIVRPLAPRRRARSKIPGRVGVQNPNSRLGPRARICKDGYLAMNEQFTAASTNLPAPPRWWGFDVASQKLDLGCCGDADVETFENSSQGIGRLLERLAAMPKFASSINVCARLGRPTKSRSPLA